MIQISRTRLLEVEQPAQVKRETERLKEQGYIHHHTAAARSYMSMVGVHPYKGRFGEGYIVEWPRRDTTKYHWRAYYVKE